MVFEQINFRNSVAFRLLTVIFGLYFVVTVIVTITQLTAEYFHEKKSIAFEILNLPLTFGEGISQAMWTFNDDQLYSILIGMGEISVVSGVTWIPVKL